MLHYRYPCILIIGISRILKNDSNAKKLDLTATERRTRRERKSTFSACFSARIPSSAMPQTALLLVIPLPVELLLLLLSFIYRIRIQMVYIQYSISSGQYSMPSEPYYNYQYDPSVGRSTSSSYRPHQFSVRAFQISLFSATSFLVCKRVF